ncbi:complement factor H isoform X1 [Dicentrarchus labrax]|uniref:complement factor H isoform X1 n=1 Tax=Dicentrarchus labrax TaxID=13489 RepID=UPI0021F5C4B2|nr:complement factor H isoform X1 [Dicentrarchus labrax]
MYVITRSCVLFLLMHTLTFVKSQECTLKQFLEGPLYDSNFDTSDLEASYPGGRQVRVNCVVGYSGFYRILCVEGQWQPKGNKCQPKSCGHPGDAQFADFHLDKGEDFVFGSKVVYTCHKGYQMVSRTNYRNCMAGGWNGVVPVCEAQQCPVIHVANNVQVIGDPEEATYGNVIRFSCKSNSDMLIGTREMYCDETGEWIGKVPICQAIECKVPDIENGFVTGDKQVYKEQEILHFECNRYYKRTEGRSSKCTKVGTGAEWTPAPMCEAIKCQLNLPPIEGTTYEPPGRSLFSPGDEITVRCTEKFWIFNLRDTSVRTECDEFGEWTITPVCKEVICDKYDPLVTSWRKYWTQVKLHETTGYTCRRGYKGTDGTNVATCTRDRWSPNPLCQEIICFRQAIDNADFVDKRKREYKNNERINYACTEGFKGNPSRICTENGWIGDSECTEITCIREAIDNADFDNKHKWEYKYNERINYACTEGYKGSPHRICKANGWTGKSKCTAILCNKEYYDFAVIKGNGKYKYKYNEQAEYTCNSGGGFTRTCGASGWNGEKACSACPKAEIQNGFVIGPFDGIVYYTCTTGYKLFTKSWWGAAQCNGQVWSGLASERCIEETKCGKIPVIPNGEVRDQLQHYGYRQNERVEITCNEGYRPRFDILTCNEGQWRSAASSLETICEPLQNCSLPPKVENSVVTSYKENFEVTYECRTGYRMEGQHTLQCVNEEWDHNITCTKAPADHTAPADKAAPANDAAPADKADKAAPADDAAPADKADKAAPADDAAPADTAAPAAPADDAAPAVNADGLKDS